MAADMDKRMQRFRRAVAASVSRAMTHAAANTQEIVSWTNPLKTLPHHVWNWVRSKKMIVHEAKGSIAVGYVDKPIVAVSFTRDTAAMPEPFRKYKPAYSAQYGSKIKLVSPNGFYLPCGFAFGLERREGAKRARVRLDHSQSDAWSWAMFCLVSPEWGNGPVGHPCNMAAMAVLSKTIVDVDNWQ